MNTSLARLLVLICCSHIVMSCDVGNSDPYPIRNAILSTSEDQDFEKVLMLINLKNQEGNYVVAPVLSDVTLKLNDEPWGSYTTSEVDTSLYDYSKQRNIHVTTEKLNYLLLAENENSIEGEATAGDYSELLNSLHDLAPGDYVLELTGLKFKDAVGNTVEVRTRQFKTFTVTKGSVNSYLGEFEVEIN